MSGLRQKILFWLWVLAVPPLQAQMDSVAVAPNGSKPERLAVLEVSGAGLDRQQSQNFARELAKVCREKAGFMVVPENALAAYIKKRRDFSIFVPASAQALCKNLALDYLIVATLERAASSEPLAEKPTPDSWQVTLRWFDGSTGQMTKIHARECSGNLNAPDSFPLHELLSSLLESPDIIVPVDNAPVEMPALATDANASPADNLATDQTKVFLSPDQTQIKRGRSWLWYLTGAALVSGGSAALLLKNASKSGSNEKTLLPEPPDPPK